MSGGISADRPEATLSTIRNSVSPIGASGSAVTESTDASDGARETSSPANASSSASLDLDQRLRRRR